MKQFLFFIAGILLTEFPVRSFNFSSPVNSKLMTQDTLTPVKVELEKTSFTDMQVLFIKDTAAATEDIKDVLGKGYGELMQFIQANQLKAVKFIAWYYSMQPPWPVDVAVETDKIPGQLTGRIQSRIQPGGDVIVAHMWGPYEKVEHAYTQIFNWMKRNNRVAKGAAFEVYLNDPASVKNPMEIRTDVYQPLEPEHH